MKKQYNELPTIVIGLGGMGMAITNRVYSRVEENRNVSAFYIDTNDGDFRYVRDKINENQNVSLVESAAIKHLLRYIPGTEDWYPEEKILRFRNVSSGTAQVRASGRLAFEAAVLSKRFENMLVEITRIAYECRNVGDTLRISIITSFCGGTGSGIFIQVALLIRKYLTMRFPTLKFEINGEFVLPSAISYMNSVDTVVSGMEANAYAALKELNAINEHVFNGAPPVLLKHDETDSFSPEGCSIDIAPYDFCFLYDIPIGEEPLNKNRNQLLHIERAIYEHIFGDSANDIYEAFRACESYKKAAGNIYGFASMKMLDATVPNPEEEICRFINDKFYGGAHQIFAVASPRGLDFSKMLLPKNAYLIETPGDNAGWIKVVEFTFGIEISQIEKLEYKKGQYYISYLKALNNNRLKMTPHLSRTWHADMPDIGAKPEEGVAVTGRIKTVADTPEKDFVFISYSTQEANMAEQTKHVLEANGIPYWMAPDSIPAGSDYGMEIPKAIDNCKVLLLLLSKASQESNWVPKEIGLAIGKGKTVVPFQIDNAVINDSFNFYLTNSQRISAYNRMTEAYQELVKRLKDILG